MPSNVRWVSTVYHFIILASIELAEYFNEVFSGLLIFSYVHRQQFMIFRYLKLNTVCTEHHINSFLGPKITKNRPRIFKIQQKGPKKLHSIVFSFMPGTYPESFGMIVKKIKEEIDFEDWKIVISGKILFETENKTFAYSSLRIVVYVQ